MRESLGDRERGRVNPKNREENREGEVEAGKGYWEEEGLRVGEGGLEGWREVSGTRLEGEGEGEGR